MSSSKRVSFGAAAAMVNDGDTIAVCGCENLLVPEKMLNALEQRFLETGHPKNLTDYHPIIYGMGVYPGLEHLANEGMVTTSIGSGFSYLKTSRMTKMVLENKVKAHLMPMGTVFKLLQSAASNVPFVLTDVGIDTFVDPRVEGGRMNEATTESLAKVVSFEGKDYLYYKTPKIDVAFIRGTTADETGNISMEEEPVHLGVLTLAMAAKASGGKVIAQVKRTAQKGSIDPKTVVVPGIFVDAVVVDEDQNFSGEKQNPALTGAIRLPLAEVDPLPLDARKVILSRAAEEIKQRTATVNLGVGTPIGIPNILVEQKRLDGITFFPEHGSVGGILGGREIFGANINPDAIIDSTDVFNAFRGGLLDVTFLGAGQIDRHGNVNVSKFNGIVPGCGGFIDIAYRTKLLVFTGTFSAGGVEIEVKDGKVVIGKEGKYFKFVEDVEQITLNGQSALGKGQRVVYITERAVFELKKDGIHLTELAPGVELEKDVLAHIPFKIIVDTPLKPIDSKHLT